MKNIIAGPGSITVKGQAFAIPQPTKTDLQRIADKMRDLARAECMSPLDYVNASIERLNPATAAIAVREAISLGSGGGIEPTREAVFRAYDSLAGIRFQLWFLARKGGSAIDQDGIKDLVTEDDRYDLADGLQIATAPPENTAPKASESGAN